MPNVHGMNWIRQEKRLAIYQRDRFRCGYCDRDLKKADRGVRTLDHLVPRERGGTNEPHNLVTCCITCNSSRQAKSWKRFAHRDAIRRIEALVRRPLNVARAKALRCARR